MTQTALEDDNKRGGCNLSVERKETRILFAGILFAGILFAGILFAGILFAGILMS